MNIWERTPDCSSPESLSHSPKLSKKSSVVKVKNNNIFSIVHLLAFYYYNQNDTTLMKNNYKSIFQDHIFLDLMDVFLSIYYF